MRTHSFCCNAHRVRTPREKVRELYAENDGASHVAVSRLVALSTCSGVERAVAINTGAAIGYDIRSSSESINPLKVEHHKDRIQEESSWALCRSQNRTRDCYETFVTVFWAVRGPRRAHVQQTTRENDQGSRSLTSTSYASLGTPCTAQHPAKAQERLFAACRRLFDLGPRSNRFDLQPAVRPSTCQKAAPDHLKPSVRPHGGGQQARGPTTTRTSRPAYSACCALLGQRRRNDLHSSLLPSRRR